jgi:hypothetical protein
VAEELLNQVVFNNTRERERVEGKLKSELQNNNNGCMRVIKHNTI